MDVGSKKATLATRMGYLDFLYGTYYKSFNSAAIYIYPKQLMG